MAMCFNLIGIMLQTSRKSYHAPVVKSNTSDASPLDTLYRTATHSCHGNAFVFVSTIFGPSENVLTGLPPAESKV